MYVYGRYETSKNCNIHAFEVVVIRLRTYTRIIIRKPKVIINNFQQHPIRKRHTYTLWKCYNNTKNTVTIVVVVVASLPNYTYIHSYRYLSLAFAETRASYLILCNSYAACTPCVTLRCGECISSFWHLLQQLYQYRFVLVYIFMRAHMHHRPNTICLRTNSWMRAYGLAGRLSLHQWTSHIFSWCSHSFDRWWWRWSHTRRVRYSSSAYRISCR